eukprot:gnl/MRDRNA2_/MRDRNA2_87877_c0_seq1.p1 gnl/MRDRNA2_/MRDRNA2_87877_c0~~gnl/MRDRNA2_/MRDRNA2_87877_c0_seq1.p1  ORF type:complete len:134 (-),score=17.97 gnl/MRDRNA2_/MRDRNA2_87877_c0_seq1:244-645(-)
MSFVYFAFVTLMLNSAMGRRYVSTIDTQQNLSSREVDSLSHGNTSAQVNGSDIDSGPSGCKPSSTCSAVYKADHKRAGQACKCQCTGGDLNGNCDPAYAATRCDLTANNCKAYPKIEFERTELHRKQLAEQQN